MSTPRLSSRRFFKTLGMMSFTNDIMYRCCGNPTENSEKTADTLSSSPNGKSMSVTYSWELGESWKSHFASLEAQKVWDHSREAPLLNQSSLLVPGARPSTRVVQLTLSILPIFQAISGVYPAFVFLWYLLKLCLVVGIFRLCLHLECVFSASPYKLGSTT